MLFLMSTALPIIVASIMLIGLVVAIIIFSRKRKVSQRQERWSGAPPPPSYSSPEADDTPEQYRKLKSEEAVLFTYNRLFGDILFAIQRAAGYEHYRLRHDDSAYAMEMLDYLLGVNLDNAIHNSGFSLNQNGVITFNARPLEDKSPADIDYMREYVARRRDSAERKISLARKGVCDAVGSHIAHIRDAIRAGKVPAATYGAFAGIEKALKDNGFELKYFEDVPSSNPLSLRFVRVESHENAYPAVLYSGALYNNHLGAAKKE